MDPDLSPQEARRLKNLQWIWRLSRGIVYQDLDWLIATGDDWLTLPEKGRKYDPGRVAAVWVKRAAKSLKKHLAQLVKLHTRAGNPGGIGLYEQILEYL